MAQALNPASKAICPKCKRKSRGSWMIYQEVKSVAPLLDRSISTDSLRFGPKGFHSSREIIISSA
jgi:hypothetical protein